MMMNSALKDIVERFKTKIIKFQENSQRQRSGVIPEWFTAMDTNHNGVLEAQEIDN
jgi:hypothetical protein